MRAGEWQAIPQWFWLKELWPNDSVVTRQPQEFVLWPWEGECSLIHSASVCVCEREREGRVKETQMLRFPFTPQFHVHYKCTRSKVNVKTLQINPESDRSSLSCLWYHFPSKWYGWGSDNCHPDLPSLHHSPKTHSTLGQGETRLQTFTISLKETQTSTNYIDVVAESKVSLTC